MGHIPYGYRIENGAAVIYEPEAEKLRRFYTHYLNGMTLKDSAEQAGIDYCHSTIGRLLKNQHYVGDDFYPAILDMEIFLRAKIEQGRRAIRHKKKFGPQRVKTAAIATEFYVKSIEQCHKDPIERAEYIYSLIEREDVSWEKLC